MAHSPVIGFGGSYYAATMPAYVCVLSAVPSLDAWSCGNIGTNLELLWGGEGVPQNCPCMRACPVVWDSFVHQ